MTPPITFIDTTDTSLPDFWQVLVPACGSVLVGTHPSLDDALGHAKDLLERSDTKEVTIKRLV